MMFVFASCTKDGVYKPKKKISKIYQTVLTDPVPEKVLIESWTWDGKLLSKIDYGDDNVVSFTYDKMTGFLTFVQNCPDDRTCGVLSDLQHIIERCPCKGWDIVSQFQCSYSDILNQ